MNFLTFETLLRFFSNDVVPSCPWNHLFKSFKKLIAKRHVQNLSMHFMVNIIEILRLFYLIEITMQSLRSIAQFKNALNYITIYFFSIR